MTCELESVFWQFIRNQINTKYEVALIQAFLKFNGIGRNTLDYSLLGKTSKVEQEELFVSSNLACCQHNEERLQDIQVVKLFLSKYEWCVYRRMHKNVQLAQQTGPRSNVQIEGSKTMRAFIDKIRSEKDCFSKEPNWISPWLRSKYSTG